MLQALRYRLFTYGRRVVRQPISEMLHPAQKGFRVEPDGAGAVLAHVGDQGERIPRRNLEPLRPSAEHKLVVRQEPPQKRVDGRMSVLCRREGIETDSGRAWRMFRHASS